MSENVGQEGQKQEEQRKNPLPRNLGLFLFAGILTGWAIDFLFWGNKPGISVSIWLVLALVLLFVLAHFEQVKAHKASYGLAVLILLAALFYSLRSEPLTLFANAAAALFGLVLLASTYANGNWLYYRLFGYVVPLLTTIFGGVFRPFGALAKVFGETSSDGKKSAGKVIWAVIRGLLITIPILVLLGSLLAAADAVFEGVMGDILDWFLIDDLGEYIFRIIYVTFFSIIFMGVFFQAILPRGVVKRPDPENSLVKPFLGWIETVMIFGGINIMFMIFVVIQFNYLFGGDRNIHTGGLNYSEYARQGFGELIAVSIISLLIYLVLANISHKSGETKTRIFSGLSVLLIVQVLVMLVSSFKRLGLYETVYGFTRLRMYTHVFIICLAVLLLVMITLEVLRIRGRFALAFLGFCFLFSFALAGVNVDARIARLNIIHSTKITHTSARGGTVLDYDYLDSLSSDAVPQLVKMYANPDLPMNSHNKIGAVLMCKLYQAEMKSDPNWRSFSVSYAIAKGQLLDMREALYDVYSIEEERGGVTVRSGDELWVCDSYWDLYLD
jgi:hypothetical protein